MSSAPASRVDTTARSAPHTIDHVVPEWRELAVSVRPVEKPGGRWRLRLEPVNYRLRRGDGLTWTQDRAFWTPRQISPGRAARKEVALRMLRRPEPLAN